MGTYAAEMCAPFCLPLIMLPLLTVEAESALCLLKEFLKCLTSQAIKALILPSIQKILQVHYEKPTLQLNALSFHFKCISCHEFSFV